MSRRLATGAAIIVWSVTPLMARDAHAQVLRVPVSPAAVVTFAANDNASAPGTLALPADANAPGTAETAQQAPLTLAQPDFEGGHSHALLPLYASTALLQILDVQSTFAALDRGAAEGNPMLKGLVANRPAFVAVKAGVAASTLFAINRMAKHHKLAAILTAVGINAAYSFVVWHNYKLAGSMR